MTIYEKNLEALKQHHPELVELMEAPISTDHIQVVQADSGAKRLMVETASGETLTVHNAVNPEQVAQSSADQISFDGGGVVVLFGMGLGYLSKALSHRLEDKGSLLVYEADPGIFKMALKLVDLTPLLTSPRIKVLVGPDADLASACYRFLIFYGGGYIRAVRYEPAFRLNPPLYQAKLEKEFTQFTNATMMNIATLDRFGPLFSRSLVEAIPHIIGAKGVNHLKDRFSGLPAILVAAGPSLQTNVHHLHEAKGRSVIIAADTVLGYLLARGVKPDLVISVDAQELTYSKYQGVDIPDDVALLFHPSCNDQIFKHFPGPKFVTETFMPTYRWLKHCWPAKGTIEGENQCQMHMGFNLAQWMGCAPIIIVGQDLCYTGDRMHVKGGTYLTEEAEALYVSQGLLTRNIFGEPVRTYPTFLNYKVTFEKKIKAFSGSVYNATEGGLPLEGAEICRLEDVLAEFCAEKGDHVSSVLRACLETPELPFWDVLVVELGDRVRDFQRLERVSRHLCRLLEEMAQLRKESKEITDNLVRLTNRAERLTNLVPRYSKALGLLQFVNFSLELFMCREDTGAIDAVEDPEEKLDKQIERGQRYYGDLVRVVPSVLEGLVRLQGRLETLRELETLQGPYFPGERELLQAIVYQSIELFDRAGERMTSYLQEKGGRPSTLHAAKLAIEIPLQLNQVGLALERAQRALECFPGNPDLETLHGLARDAWQKWHTKIESADSSRTRPHVPCLEAGDFYYRVKNYRRSAEKYRQAATDGGGSEGEAWYRLAKAYQMLGEHEEAIQALEQGLLANPADSRIYFDLGVMALETNRLEVGERFFVKGADVSLEDPVYCEAVAAVLCAAGAPLQAIPFYERALGQCPGDPDLLRKISEAYQSVFTPVASA